MLQDLNQRLAAARERERRAQKLQARLGSARQALKDELARSGRLKQRLAKEEDDVKKLEGLSVASLVARVLGNTAQRLDKERQEVLAAQLQHQQTQRALAEIRDDIHQLATELAALGDTTSETRQLLEEKERFLVETQDPTAEVLVELSQQLADLQADGKELREAIEAGNVALGSLRNARSKLDSADDWSTLDLFGGGVLTTLAKHSALDEAKDQAQQAQRDLRRFRNELAEAGERLQGSLHLDGLTSFGDYFLEGFFDWIVHSKIQDARTACENTLRQTQSVLHRCRQEHQRAKTRYDELSARQCELIESA